jgi:hypothetical protein
MNLVFQHSNEGGMTVTSMVTYESCSISMKSFFVPISSCAFSVLPRDLKVLVCFPLLQRA